MNSTVESSYALCQRTARRSSSSFYYAFLLLPRAKRRAMCALYAFLRKTDDLGDDTTARPEATLEQRLEALERWREAFHRGLAGQHEGTLLPAVIDTIQRYSIPPEHLEAVIDGVQMDLRGERYETFDDLAVYCHRVASAVGLACIHIWGFHGDCALEPARKCGLAFQLTNILRDLKEDAEQGRVYLPAEDLRRFAYSADDLRHGVRDARFKALMQLEIERAEDFYRQGSELEQWLSSDGQAIFGAMISTYRGLLDEIRRLEGDVFSSRVRLSPWRRMRIAARWLLRRPLLTSGRL